jgi:hypothetical protein
MKHIDQTHVRRSFHGVYTSTCSSTGRLFERDNHLKEDTYQTELDKYELMPSMKFAVLNCIPVLQNVTELKCELKKL